MSALVSRPTTTEKPAWPADLLEFARRNKVDGYLEPLLEATRRLFPRGEIKVFLEKDPEIADLWFLIYEAHVPIADVPDYRAITRAWFEEYQRIVPYPRNAPFVFDLRRVD